MSAVAINYDAPTTVAAFMDSDAFVRCIVGPLGSGKSSGCVLEILRRAVEQTPGPDGIRRTRFAVIRNTRPQLEDTTRKTFEQWIPDALGTWHEQEFTFTIEFDDVYCEVLFRALDRPQDVKKVLSLELTGAYINEAREIPKEVIDGLQGRVGRFPPKKDGGATWFGIWMDTNPWHVGHWGYKLFSKEKPEGFELFEQPGGRDAAAENVENLPDGYYQRLTHGKSTDWVEEYVDGKYPEANRGSIFGRHLSALERAGGLAHFEHPSDGVFATFDLGVSDSTAIWWWRINRHGVPDIIDWYECSGEGAQHYFTVLRSKPWQLRKIWLPHDARQRSFQTGVGTLEQFITEYGAGMIAITPELSIDDGIDAARWMLQQPMRIHPRCEKGGPDGNVSGTERLREYKFAWDPRRLAFSKTPLHDWTSHSADSFRYVACAVRASELMARPAAPKPPPPGRSIRMTLDEELEAHESATTNSRRI